MFGFLVWRDIKICYKQTILGGLWVVFQPLTAMLVSAPFFNRLAGIQTDGPPYALITLSKLVHWTFFANSVSRSSNNLAGNKGLVSKIYFPRVFISLASIGALVLYLTIGLLLGLEFDPMSGMVGFRRSMLGGPSNWATVALSLSTSFFIFGRIVYLSERGAALRGHHLNLNSQLRYLVITGEVLRMSLFMRVPTP